MSGWTLAGEETGNDSVSLGARYGGWAAGAFATAAALWFFLFATGIVTTLGSADGSERHDALGIRPAEHSQLGLSTMYVTAGQRLWWDYDVAVEGSGGVRLRIAKSPPSQAFVVRFHDVSRTGRGRFEVVAPESGFYSFSHDLIPQGGPLGTGAPGATGYDLSWGVD